ncbi:hypothetical protein IGS59_10470 [Janthinobacterium sp. GW460P]|uniref:hypothetical protein n=1 Tax=unclassified Janthinobacterium TaxID=2610881 RepID=UPI000A324488|nr:MULTISPECIES: hypothetical protein [unclassified Janthinobacterium]MCC7702665.1 hypothetical protein [Janthinobacterium sp. GW460P]MCC7708173.1 hypothetical protein [Janthinobacterium sp. GW460W]
MLRLFKTWLILLLIAAVPLQAAAAGAMRLCPASSASPASAMAAACQHHAGRSAVLQDNTGTPEKNQAPDQHRACGACLSFCLGALMPPCFTLPAAAGGAQHFSSAPAALLAGFIPDGPRRPPRPLSA